MDHCVFELSMEYFELFKLIAASIAIFAFSTWLVARALIDDYTNKSNKMVKQLMRSMKQLVHEIEED